MGEKIEVTWPKWLDESLSNTTRKAKATLQAFTVNLLSDDIHFLRLELKNDKGVCYQYVLSKNTGHFFMYTKEKDFCIKPHGPMTLHQLCDFISNKDRFVGALDSNPGQIFEFNYPKAQDDLQKAREEAEAFYGEDVDSFEEVDEDFNRMVDILSEYGEEVYYRQDFVERWMRYNSRTNSLALFGKVIALPVYICTMGFLIACDKAGLIHLVYSD